jgi:branched-chain amino acid transport system permease protein
MFQVSRLPNAGRAVLTVTLVVVVLALPTVLNSYYLTLAVSAGLWAYLSVCWNLSGGYAGLFSFGHTAFFAAGAYTSTLLYTELAVSPWLGMFAGAGMGALLALIIAVLAVRYRIRGMYFSLATVAVVEILRPVLDTWSSVGGSTGILLPLLNSPGNMLFIQRAYYYYVIVGLVAVAMLVTWMIARSRLGYYAIAIREDETAAEVSGGPSARVKRKMLAISAALTAVGGTFYAQFYLFIQPEIVLGWDPQMQMILGTMVGGPGTVAGPVVGSLAISVLTEVLQLLPIGRSPEIAAIVMRLIWGVILVAVMLYLPGGLLGMGLHARKRARVARA